MPVYLFTFHGYGTWMPDRQQGYVRRRQGILAADPAMAARYRRNASFGPATFTAAHQQTAINTLLDACPHLYAQPRAIATDATHVHVIASWADERPWRSIRASLKKSLALALKQVHALRPWLADNASRKQIKDRRHYDHLLHTYLPSHRGLKWSPQRGVYP